MRGFLSEVAEDLYGRYGDQISELSVLFPSRRAHLFFIDSLSEITLRPMWQPEWLTIGDLMSEVSGLREGDRVRLITELYKIYVEYHPEPFDKFYFWGELLLNDFDTIDKYLVDADQLFRNISDIKELEADVSYLTPVQLQILRDFWSSLIGGDLTEEKRKFMAVWHTLAKIYHQFRARLEVLGIAYAGMIQRRAVERLEVGDFVFATKRHYVVAGFNALSECEKHLFKYLSLNAETDFYWDYDDYYSKSYEQEAGLFVRDNLRMFPPRTELSHEAMRQPKQITSVAASSDAVQCKYVARILDELMLSGVPLGKQTAIVLTDENLLMPLLYALPAEVGKVNVTMGYPLRQSLAYTFVERLLELQKRSRRKGESRLFYHADVTGLLSHPYIAESDPDLIRTLHDEIVSNRRITIDRESLARNELLSLVFADAGQWSEWANYLADVIAAVAKMPYEGDDARRRVEFLAVISEHVAKLRNSLSDCGVEISTSVFASLLRRTLQTLRIPFVGEPLKGLQVMGILETRNLDFENVIILSMNDDNFPGNMLSQPSFVPYNLRMAYGLPTPEHHEGVYAYYFYRLIQRAQKVWMLYSSRADDRSTGEPSRYIYQLSYESGLPLNKLEVGVDVNLAPSSPIVVAKDEAVMRRLASFTTDSDNPSTLSPTAFSRYVACPLKFYFYSIARVRSDDELSEEVDNPLFGTILHEAVQHLYERIVGEQHPAATLAALISSGEVEHAVDQAITTHCLRDDGATEADYTGNLLIVRDIVIRYIRDGVIRYDTENNNFAVRGLEDDLSYNFPFVANGSTKLLKFAGRADRIDSLDSGTLRVVDYKTGTPHLDYRGIDMLFDGKGSERLPNILQTLLYAMMLHYAEKREVEPALYYVREMHRDGYSPLLVNRAKLSASSYTDVQREFEDRVRTLLAELFNPAVPFVQCADADTCKFCDFATICRR